MRVGINLINFGPGASPESLARAAELGEALGYHLLMISDHVAITPDVQARYPAPLYDPFTTLAWLAGLTRRVELGTTVIILPYRHPIETARMAANVDRLSGGRFILGIGAGWARQEFDALGVPFHRRGAMTDDYLAAIEAVWARRSPPTRDASRPSASAHGSPPRAAPATRPSGWAGRATPRCAAPCGTATRGIPSGSASTGSATRACRGSARSRRRGPPLPALCPRIRLRLTDRALADEARVAGEGSLDQVRADLEALQGLGAPYVLLDTYADDPEATRDPDVASACCACSPSASSTSPARACAEAGGDPTAR